MVERYVFIRLKKEHAHERQLVVSEARRVLVTIPRVASVEVGTPADDHALDAWDVSLRIRFDSIYDVEPYRVHPTHRRFVDEFLKPRIDVVKAWNFDVG
ncbi:Dabb family protein [Haliangium sp.]|uniref:Dabb family protein n=1 Tax=Haliangium sp. TaxID=2663208 RepID=UPI003D0E7823